MHPLVTRLKLNLSFHGGSSSSHHFPGIYGWLYSGDGSVPRFARYEEGIKFNGTFEIAQLTDDVEKKLPFFEEIAWYLSFFGIKAKVRVDKTGDKYKVRLIFSQSIDNVLNFLEFIPISLSPAKREKFLREVESYLAAVPESSLAGRIEELREHFNRIKKGERRSFIETWEVVNVTYNVTTETGNLLANGLFVKNSGGLGTPAHLRVEPGMIHRAHKGVLFIDEIATLSLKMQQSLLTAMQEKKFPITGQSELSRWSYGKNGTCPMRLHTSCRREFRHDREDASGFAFSYKGYGYEVYMRTTMPDTPENRRKLVQFVAGKLKRR